MPTLPGKLSSLPAVRVYERDWTYFTRVITGVLLSSLFQPLLYLLGVGIGVGRLVDGAEGSVGILGGESYFAFYATALIATTSMFIQGQEALWPTMDGFTYSNTYGAMIATPIEPRDIVLARMLHYSVRGIVTCSGVALVLAVFDDTRSWGLLPAIPAGVLTGLAFAMPFAAWTATRQGDISFPAIIRFGMIPMFLFGGAFYPISQLPDWLRPVAWATPLWHGVELVRGLVLGGRSVPVQIGHVLVLAGFVLAGTWAAAVTFERRLRV